MRESRSQRDLAGFPARRFRVGYEEHATGKVDMLRALGEQFAPAQPRVEGGNNKVAEMGCGRVEELRFLGEAQDRPWLPALSRQPDAGQWVCGQEALIHRPIKKMAEDFNIAVERGFGEPLLFVPLRPVFPDGGLRDRADRPLAEVG